VAASLRSFTPRDRDAVVALSRHALARPEDQVGNPIWSTREDLETELADWDPPAEETLLVAEDEDRVVGFGGVELPKGFPHAELFGPIVDPAHQGQRLGSRLLEASLDHARDHHVGSITTAVGTRNTGGQILLEQHGFRARGTPQATYLLTPAEHRPVTEPLEGLTIRRATKDDLDALLALYHECFPGGRFPDDVWRENVHGGTVYAAEADGRILAVLNIDPGDRWIYHIGVTESERNRGVGSYLLSTSLEDYWREHPGETLGLDVTTDNVAAIRLYRRQGFAPWLVLQAFERPL
jgi:ribosomal protein S18 acetylase RimI-like enzyme